ncbi:hypothetical protein Ato02nite_098610 [Paractinoplanes toevensis]|uniref:Uncharacterized protein n=1 Tax=Paractinoplanes toevensis TaxID=571911 RepID=A0A920BRF2_9ACTN|nr:hypothetical protein Ato02nite_098610 [Actinoplanes toevensis]
MDLIPAKEPAHRPSDSPAIARASRHAPGPVNRTAVSDARSLDLRRTPGHGRAHQLRSFLLGVLDQPGLRHLKG